MVLEADYRVRGQHSLQQSSNNSAELTQQQAWGMPYQQHMPQQRQVPGLPLPAQPPQMRFVGPGVYQVPLQAMYVPFALPSVMAMGRFPVHLMAMPSADGQHYVRPQQHIVQQQPQQQWPTAPRERYGEVSQRTARASAHNAVQVRPGALPAQQPMQAAAVMDHSAGSSASQAPRKPLSVGSVPHGRRDGTLRQAAPAASGDSTLSSATCTVGQHLGVSSCADSLDGSLVGEDDAASCCETETGDWAESIELPPADEAAQSGWAWLVDGIAQQVLRCLKGHSSSLSAFRATCVQWRNYADSTTHFLSPKALLPKDLIRLFPTLQHLQLVSCRNVRNRDLYVLANNDLHLTSLVLGDDSNKPWVTNRGIESIAKMSSLKFLALHDCNSITNNGITAMSTLTGLDKLSLRGCRKLTNKGMETIKMLTNVTQLNLYGCKRLSDAGIQQIIGMPLVALALGQTRIRDDSIGLLTALTRLTELHLVKEEVRDAGLQSLATMTQLEVLSLRDMRLSNHPVTVLMQSLTNLKNLSLYRNPEITDALLLRACIMNMTNLTSLDLRETSISDLGVDQCSQLHSLRVLQLKPSLNQLQHPLGHVHSYPSVKGLTQLTSLCVAVPLLSTVMMEAVGTLTGLQDLTLGRGCVPVNKALDDEPLHAFHYAEIARLVHLTSLDISRRKVCAEQVHRMIKRLPLLRYINLGSSGLRPRGRSIKDLARSNPTVFIDARKSMAEITPDLASYGLAGTLCVL